MAPPCPLSKWRGQPRRQTNNSADTVSVAPGIRTSGCLQHLFLKLHNPSKTLLFGKLLDSYVQFGGAGVILIPKPGLLLRQEPGLSWVLLRLVPEKKAQLRAAPISLPSPQASLASG